MMAMAFFHRLFRRAPTSTLDANVLEPASNDAEGQYHLGLKYDRAPGEGQDFATAARWYLRAAEQNHASAQFNLGVLYAAGHGVAKDDTRAILWISKAAQQGHPAAQFALGLRHYRTVVQTRSMDVPEAKIEAYKWLHLAAAQDYPDSDTTCCRVILSMTRDEVADGNRRVAAFHAEHRLPLSISS